MYFYKNFYVKYFPFLKKKKKIITINSFFLVYIENTGKRYYLVSQNMHACMLNCFSCVQLFATLWTEAHQFPVSMGFSSQKYWSGLPRSFLEDLPAPGIEPASPIVPALQVDS